MKICPLCEKEFEIPSRQGGMNRTICYDCVPDGMNKNDRHQRMRRILRERASEIKLNKSCERCGYNRYPEVLEWHHDNDDEKKFNPSDRLSSGTIKAWLEYLEEIAKCSLFCANCHREVHIELKIALRENL